jgi:hypothetical protein
VGLFAATGPVFLEVVENWLSFVVLASCLTILIFQVVFPAALIDASEFSFFCHKLFFSFGLASFFFFLFLLDL